MDLLSNNPLIFPILGLMIFSLISKSSNPIMIGMLLLLFAMNTIIMTSKLIKSSMMSYILFLMMIGGLLIMFLYFLSLSPKKSVMAMNFNSTKTSIKSIIIMIIIILLMVTLSDNSPLYDINPINFCSTPVSNQPPNPDHNLSNIYYSMKFITLITISYLFLTMVIVVKMCIHFNKPLRQMKKN